MASLVALRLPDQQLFAGARFSHEGIAAAGLEAGKLFRRHDGVCHGLGDRRPAVDRRSDRPRAKTLTLRVLIYSLCTAVGLLGQGLSRTCCISSRLECFFVMPASAGVLGIYASSRASGSAACFCWPCGRDSCWNGAKQRSARSSASAVGNVTGRSHQHGSVVWKAGGSPRAMRGDTCSHQRAARVHVRVLQMRLKEPRMGQAQRPGAWRGRSLARMCRSARRAGGVRRCSA